MEVNREIGLGPGETDKISIPARARRPDSPPLSRFTLSDGSGVPGKMSEPWFVNWFMSPTPLVTVIAFSLSSYFYSQSLSDGPLSLFATELPMTITIFKKAFSRHVYTYALHIYFFLHCKVFKNISITVLI